MFTSSFSTFSVQVPEQTSCLAEPFAVLSCFSSRQVLLAGGAAADPSVPTLQSEEDSGPVRSLLVFSTTEPEVRESSEVRRWNRLVKCCASSSASYFSRRTSTLCVF